MHLGCKFWLQGFMIRAYVRKSRCLYLRMVINPIAEIRLRDR